MKLLSICLYMALLVGCTSQPLNVRYYLLHTPENKVSNTADETKPIIVLQLLNVADYLRQASLVMQINQHELYYSRQDVWAEKLHSSFYKALLQDLNANGQRHYVTESSPNAAQAVTVISINLDHFHATNDSTVVNSGRYWLTANSLQQEKSKDLATSSHAFYFESDLKQDGYAHAVEQLRILISSLSKQIEKDIAAVPHS